MPASTNGPDAWLHHVQLTAKQPDSLADFYSRALMMRKSALADGYLCEGPSRRTLFSKGPSRRAGFSAFAFETADALASYRHGLETGGLQTGASPSPLFNSTAFSVVDPDGNRIVFGTAERDAADAGPGPDARLQHVTFRTRNVAPLLDFYRDRLDFHLTDLVAADGEKDLRTVFFASDREHHSLAAFKGDDIRLDHHSYELSGWDRIRDWADHFATLGLSLRWGPGRHGPGNNLFIFLEDPEGNWIELSAELETMDVRRATGRWPHEARTLNLWGAALMRS